MHGCRRHPDPYVQAAGSLSLLAMPIVKQGQLVAVLLLENNLAREVFTRDRVETLSILASQTAISIENAVVYASLEQRVEERTRELRDAQARLVRLEREATESRMAGGFAHEMRNALAGAKLVLEKALGRVSGPRRSLAEASLELCEGLAARLREPSISGVGEEVFDALRQIEDNERRLQRTLDGVSRSADRALRVTELILEYSRLSTTRPGSAEVPIADLARAILADPALAGKEIQARVSVPPEDVLLGTPQHLDCILRNLVANAVEALDQARATQTGQPGEDGGRGRAIEISGSREGGRYLLEVRDTGTGIRDEHRPRIFEPFFTTRPDKGTGLGLGFVAKLASLYGGEVEVESRWGQGSSFKVKLPGERVRAS